jgi:hypothetical protein
MNIAILDDYQDTVRTLVCFTGFEYRRDAKPSDPRRARMQTIQMTRDEIEARTGRFDKLQPMEFMKHDTTVSQAAKDIILTRKLMLTIITRGINDRNDIGLPPAIARQIEAVDPNALEMFKTKMGLRFDAGLEV